MRGARFTLVLERDAASDESDLEGMPIVASTARRLVRGSLSMLSAREVLRAQSFGEGLTAAAHLESSEDVDRRDRVVLLDEHNLPMGVPAHLRGTWTVGAVRHARPLLRVLLRREPLIDDETGQD